MTDNLRPLIPVNPDGLEDVAASLLQGTPEISQDPEKAVDLKGYIYVPSSRLYFAKERSLQGLNWTDTHKKALSEGLGRMPTPKETWGLISYVKSHLNNPQLKSIYDDILKTTPQNTWHGEWQNAKFSKDSNGMYVQRVVSLDKKGDVAFSNREKLEDCLMEDGWADFNSTNKQGLLTRKHSNSSYVQGDNIYFWFPRDGAVAGFGADSGGSGLDCDWGPTDTSSSLGVRLVREAPPKNGGKT